MKNTYKTYRVLISAGPVARSIDVVAVSIEAAHADIVEGFGDVRIITTAVLG